MIITRFKTWLITLSIASMLIFGLGHDPRIDILIATVMWIYIIVVLLVSVVIFVGALTATVMIMVGDSELLYINLERETENVVNSFEHLRKYRWWKSIPAMSVWVGTLTYVQWTGALTVYIINVALLLTSILLIQKVICTREDDETIA